MRRQRAGAPPAGGAARLNLGLAPGLRVGLYGGSFDPPHDGHQHVARLALRRLRLDRLIWLVSPGNPLKRGPRPLRERLEAVRSKALLRGMQVSDAEARLGSRHTLDTVRRLQARFVAVRFVFVMGADGLAQLHLWKGWADLFETLPIAVVARPGFSLVALGSPAARRYAAARLPERAAARLALALPPAWVFLGGPLHSSSSTALRNQDLTPSVEGVLE